MQEENHLFQGLKRDNHQIRQESSFLWNAHNIRLTNRDDSTLLSITNERGTSDENVTFMGYYVGHCVLGKYLVVFTANDDDSDNYIYRVEKTDTGYKTIILFHEENGWDKSWNPNYPIEAIGVYETELVQKVYWVDGKNQPRVINIAKPELELPTHIDVNGKKYPLLINGVNLSGPNYSEDSNVAQYLDYTIPNGLYQKESFDFVRTLKLQEQVDVSKSYGQGEFSSGVIQYALSYYDKYGQESNICYVTPLYYISPKDRAGSPEEKVSCSFNINIWKADTNFTYARIYSIHRTSINAVPTVKIIADIPTYRKNLEDPISYCDTGDVGRIVDPTQLLYIGGRSIIPRTITQKDNTLFFGNYELQSGKNIDNIKQVINDWELDDFQIPTNHGPVRTEGVYYSYEPSLSYANSAGFKYGETYRYGIQVQYDNGEWSEPIFLGDNELCSTVPWETYPYRDSKSITIYGEDLGKNLRGYGVRKIRTCIVFPSPNNTEVICQGVLCPTIRRANSQWDFSSSWFFRPSTKDNNNNNLDVYHGATIAFTHNTPLKTGADRGAEIQGMTAPDSNGTADGGGNGYLVDENVVTFHSPDLEFNPNIANTDFTNTRLRVVGIAKLGAIYGDIDIRTSSPGINQEGASGQEHHIIGYTTGIESSVNGGLISGLFYRDSRVKKDAEGNYSSDDTSNYWMVYPWHRSGSLNNDENRPTDKGARSAVLSKKKLSNLKFFNENISLGVSPILYNISTPQLFSSNEVTLTKLRPAYIGKDATYLGNVDTLITNKKFNIYQGSEFNDTLVETSGSDVIKNSSEPVRIKYKSSPHLVFSLGDDKTSIELLPRHISLGGPQDENFTFPKWMQPEESVDNDTFDGILYQYTSDILNIYMAEGGVIQIQADSSLLGNFAVGKWKKYNGGDSGYDLYQCREGRREVSWVKVNIPNEGLILKAHKTIISPSNHYLPNTIPSDYSTFREKTTLNKTKYYKATYNSNKELVLEDVTDEHKGDSSIESISYKLKRQVFGGEGIDTLQGRPYLLIGEIIRDKVDNKFGEDGETGTENMWFPAGRPVSISDDTTSVTIPFEYGDTWYSRYDCLKTYPFTQEDENQVVEIGSFMCETRVNIDGRSDRNRGQLSNLNMSPQNFNLMNEVYTQRDNFFNYRKLDKDYYKQNKFANQITWSKEKSLGEEVDTWTNITLANTLDLDGEKDEITALVTWNEQILCFQKKAVSQIMFNSRAQIPVSDGVPIEISNGYKVDGSRAFSSNIGCDDKNSIITTSQGVYFIDSNTDAIYLFNGQLANLSDSKGMNWWVKQSNIKNVWKPISYNNQALNGVRAFYDSKYGDVYFTPGPTDAEIQPDALCYSEKLGQFVSLMSYGGTQAMFNFADGFYSLRHDGNNLKLYQNNVGEYNNFYGEYKGWDFSFISNENPTYTKIFDTIELRADHYQTYNTEELLNDCPMTFIKVSNEYQQADDTLDNKNMRKKFRVWRGTIPRNNGTRQRIRNPWAMITLGWTPYKDYPEYNTRKAVIHDVSVKYTV